MVELKLRELTGFHQAFTPANPEMREPPQDMEPPLLQPTRLDQELLDKPLILPQPNTNQELVEIKLQETLELQEPTNLQATQANTEVEVELETFPPQEDTEPAE